MKTTNNIAPLYQQVKEHILARIQSGEWHDTHRVPSENQLVQEFNISRMTANRALRELTTEGHLVRVAGVGTFVASNRARSHLLEIHNIADEIKARGHVYSAEVVMNTTENANANIAKKLEIKKGIKIFHSIVIHREEGIPIQLENRYINRKIVPGYGKADFTKMTPTEYLLKVAPLQEVEHIVRAIVPDRKTIRLLDLQENEPCLLLLRRTWSKGGIATFAQLYHPASRYELSDRLKS